MIHSLAQLDFAVIALALGDSMSSLKHKGRGILARLIFGPKLNELPLANPRLEALRQYVVLRRMHGNTLTDEARAPIQDAGYGPSDLNEIDRVIDTFSVSRR